MESMFAVNPGFAWTCTCCEIVHLCLVTYRDDFAVENVEKSCHGFSLFARYILYLLQLHHWEFRIWKSVTVTNKLLTVSL